MTPVLLARFRHALRVQERSLLHPEAGARVLSAASRREHPDGPRHTTGHVPEPALLDPETVRT